MKHNLLWTKEIFPYWGGSVVVFKPKYDGLIPIYTYFDTRLKIQWLPYIRYNLGYIKAKLAEICHYRNPHQWKVMPVLTQHVLHI